MESFSITCTTCQARLRVRNTSAIGQILTCPKCSSMVLIEAPTGSSSGESLDLSTEPAGELIRVVKPPPRKPLSPASGGLASRPPATQQRTDEKGQRLRREMADTVEDPTHYGTVEVGESTSPETASETAHVESLLGEPRLMPSPAETLAAETIAPDTILAETIPATMTPAAPIESLTPADWSDVTARSRRWLLVGLAGSTGVILAFVLFIWLAGRGRDVNPPMDSATANRAVVPLSDSTTETGSTPSDGSEPGSHPETPASESVATSAIASETGSSPMTPGPRITDAAVTDAAAARGAPSTTPPAELPPGTSQTARVVPSSVTPPAEAAKPPTDPAKPGPEANLSPPDFAPSGDGDRKADQISGSGSLSETLRKLGGLFDPSADPPPDNEPPLATATPREVSPAKDEPIRLPRPAHRAVDVAARLHDPILEIQFQATPLEDVLEFVSNLSTIPITVEPEAVIWRNATPATPITLSMRDTTVAGLLEEILGKLGLTAKPLDEQINVVLRASSADSRRKVKLSLDDLVGQDPAKLAEIATYIRQLIAPGSWDGPQSRGSITSTDSALEVEHTEDVVFQVIALCEKLRIARGLPARSKFDARHFQLATRSDRAQTALSRVVTLNYSRPTPFVKIIDRLEKEAGIHLLIDWVALAELGWNPDAEVSWTVADAPTSKALDSLLTPMELTYRVIDETLTQITTTAAITRRPDIEFYRLPQPLDTAQPLPTQLPTVWAVLTAASGSAGGGTGNVQYDAASQCLLVALPQPAQRAVQQAIRDLSSTTNAQPSPK